MSEQFEKDLRRWLPVAVVALVGVYAVFYVIALGVVMALQDIDRHVYDTGTGIEQRTRQVAAELRGIKELLGEEDT